MKIIIMRGIPGAGKSTWAKNFKELRANPDSVIILSADNEMIEEDGVYRFKPEKLGDAHKNVLKSFVRLCHRYYEWHSGPDYIIVDNTNTKLWEISPYYQIANCLDIEVEIVQLTVDVNTGFNRNVHGVPEKQVQYMAMNIEKEWIPPWWNVRKV